MSEEQKEVTRDEITMFLMAVKREVAERWKWLSSDEGKAVMAAMAEWKEFWNGPEGQAARNLLAVTDSHITFARSPAGVSMTQYFIAGLTVKGLEVVRQYDACDFRAQNAGLETDIQWFFGVEVTPENFVNTVRARLAGLADLILNS